MVEIVKEYITKLYDKKDLVLMADRLMPRDKEELDILNREIDNQYQFIYKVRESNEVKEYVEISK